MKSFIELQQYKKCITLFLVGFLCSTLALVTYIVDPVKQIVKMKTSMSPNSMMFSLWRKPPIDVYIKVYIFNITNANAFLNGDEKLKVQEIGPYVYQEMLENQNITWNDNGTISYIPNRTVIFRRELSVGSPDEDFVTVPNIPMLGISSSLRNAGYWVNLPFTQMVNMLDSQPILRVTVHDYLWGYDDSLVSLAHTVVPSYIDFKKFGLLDRMYDEGKNLVNMNIKSSKNMLEEEGRYMSIESINGSPGLSHWGYIKEEGNTKHPENTKCNKITGTTEGVIFPVNMDPKAVFRVFRKAFCRPIPIAFVKKIESDGLPAYMYSLPDDFADPPEMNPDNSCYCHNGECMKKGLMDLTPCYYRIPAAASLPHFLDADPSLLKGVEGLKPDPEKHKTKIILQPTIGIPMHVNSRLQTNLVMKETYYNSKISVFNNLTVPLFWSDFEIPALPDDLLMIVKLAIKIGPVAQNVVIILLVLSGFATICWSIARTFVTVQELQQKELADKERRDSTDLRIPLGYSQYTAIRILPTIKKITSKTDLFA